MDVSLSDAAAEKLSSRLPIELYRPLGFRFFTIFREDGTPYRKKETGFIRKITKHT